MDRVLPDWVKLTVDQKEARRLEAGRELLAGVRQVDVAKKYGVTPQAVSEWKAALAAGGLPGLAAVPKSGRPHKLAAAEKERLLALLEAGPEAAGFESQLWSGAEVRALIAQRFGVEFHEKYIQRFLRGLGYRLRTPDRQALEKDPAKKAAWQREVWEAAKKNSKKAPRSFSSTKRATR